MDSRGSGKGSEMKKNSYGYYSGQLASVVRLCLWIMLCAFALEFLVMLWLKNPMDPQHLDHALLDAALLPALLAPVLYFAVFQPMARSLEAQQRWKLAAQASWAAERAALERTVVALADGIESRDTFKAGHQRQVAALAAAIAAEMAMPDEEIETVRLAARIHDIGIVAVPTDVLNRPARLMPAELELIKTHPQVGHDMLKGAGYSDAVARIILQHHERLDGSGYPQGLKDEAILPGARIVGVADVVNAIVSRRAYRPALAMDAAAEEIKRYKGIRYDPDAVDACLRLVNGKHFEFP